MTDATTPLPGFEERFADAKAARIRYFVGGEGPPLVLVHGLGGAASNWVELAPALARRHRLLIPDLPGHGGSSPLPAAPGLAPFADRVAIVAEREAMLPAPVVGHSMGAVVALRLAVRRPGDVEGIVVAAGAGISTGRRVAEVTVSLISLLQPGRRIAPYRALVAGKPWLRELALGTWGVSDAQSLSPRAAEGFLAGPELHTDVEGAGRALIAEDPRGDLDRVRCPCLVLWGARDRWVPLEDGLEYARRLRAPLRIVPDCGHLLIGERPDACLHAIETFLDSLDRDQSRQRPKRWSLARPSNWT